MKKRIAAALVAAATAAPIGAVSAKEVLPDSGPLAPNTMRRLLLVDGTRVGERVVAVGDRGYIVTSDDEGASWKRSKAPAAPLLTSVKFIDAKRGWAVGHDAVILTTGDGGETWTQQFSAPSEQRPLLDIFFLDARRGFAVGAYGAFYETSDAGAKWNPRKITADDKHLNAVVDAGAGTLLILGEAGTILRSADSGATWQPVASPYKGSFFGGVAAKDGSVLAFGLRGRIYRSTDAGKTWSHIANPLELSIMSGSLMPDGVLVLTGAAGTVLVSRDDGRSFAAVAAGRVGVISRALRGKADTLLLMGEAGVRELRIPAAR